MADTKLKNLSAATIVLGSDVVYGLQGTAATPSDRKITVNQVNTVLADTLATTAGAASIGILDAAADYTATNVETALAEVKALVDTNVTKLAGIEAGADVTDTTNVVNSLNTGDNNLMTAAQETKLDSVTTGADVTVDQIALTGDVTSVGYATTIAAAAVDQAMLSATGTKDSTTFLRGDYTWGVPPGAGDMVAANNLSDLTNDATARTNLGVTSAADTAAITVGKGASLTGVYDVAGWFTGTTVEAVLAEIGSDLDTALQSSVTVVTGVTGVLTVADHSGNWLISTGAATITVPNTVGFQCVIECGTGATNTVTFDGGASAAMAVGDIMTIAVSATGSCQAVLTAAADKVTFA